MTVMLAFLIAQGYSIEMKERSTQIDTPERQYLTETCHSVEELMLKARASGVIMINPSLGGGYDGYPDNYKSWLAFQGADIEVSPSQPITRLTRYEDGIREPAITTDETFTAPLFELGAGGTVTLTGRGQLDPRNGEPFNHIWYANPDQADYRLVGELI